MPPSPVFYRSRSGVIPEHWSKRARYSLSMSAHQEPDQPTEMSSNSATRKREFKAAWAEAVHATHEGSLEEMVPFLDSPWPAVRSEVVGRMRKRGMVEAVPLLIGLAAREDKDSVRASIALALRDFQDERAADTLYGMCEAGPDEVGFLASQGLSRLGDDRVIPIAVSWYRSGGRMRRGRAIYDLSLLGTPDGDKALADLIAGEQSWRQRASNRRVLRRAEKWRVRHR